MKDEGILSASSEGRDKREEGIDPASVVYDAIEKTREIGADVLICDTAGRLHNKKW